MDKKPIAESYRRNAAILEIQDLSVTFRQRKGLFQSENLPVISRLNVTVNQGEIVAVVGASGSGKSLLAHSILGILPANARISGEMNFLGEPLTTERIRKLRGKEIALVPQGVTYLDPLMKVGAQVREQQPGKEGKRRQKELFSAYGLPEKTEERYPFECSGGMNRRILLSTALMERPKLIVADEPTPGMDLEQAKRAMADFRAFASQGNGVLLITHDLPLAISAADRIAVFYSGTTVEEAPSSDFAREELLRHPYTRALWRAMPQNGFQAIPGTQPYVKDMPKGCVFGPRCPKFTKECLGDIPMRTVRQGTVRCILQHDEHKIREARESKDAQKAQEKRERQDAQKRQEERERQDTQRIQEEREVQTYAGGR